MNVNFYVNLGRKCHLRPFTSKIKNACKCIKGRICGRYDLITEHFPQYLSNQRGYDLEILPQGEA